MRPMELVIHDLADLIEQPLHRLGLHSFYWVIASGLLGLLILLGIAGISRRFRSRTQS
jgi:hypothetical protein